MASDEKNRNLKPRPPIVAVMGHVDHGKTTLLDYIRKTNVAGKEAGGITQSIGAYEIEHRTSNSEQAKRITFIDTPGHEAFAKMRSRGANAADLAILVVAADEGVKPQTQESIKVLLEAKTPFVVAITKTDKQNADIEKVKNELTAAGVLLEGYGGQTSYQPVSAKTGENVNELLDLIILSADLEDLAYDPQAPASGFILETKIDPRHGLETMLIVKNGTLKRGEDIFTKTAKGKVKILEDFLGKQADKMEPSAPALVIGFENSPAIGEEFSTETIAEEPQAKQEVPARLGGQARALTPENTEKNKILKIILKAGDSGSLEALSEIFKKMAVEKPLIILASSVGDVNDNDVKLAIPSEATIISFKSGINKSSENLARINKIKIVSSKIIYELVKAIEEFLKQMENPELLGVLEVLAVFSQENTQKQVVGGKVSKGIFRNRANFEIERDERAISSGKVINLQQQKKDVGEAREGNEAGVLVSAEIPIKTGDKLIIRE